MAIFTVSETNLHKQRIVSSHRRFHHRDLGMDVCTCNKYQRNFARTHFYYCLRICWRPIYIERLIFEMFHNRNEKNGACRAQLNHDRHGIRKCMPSICQHVLWDQFEIRARMLDMHRLPDALDNPVNQLKKIV